MTLNRLLIASATALGIVALTHRPANGAIYGFRTGVASSTILGDFDESIGSDYRLGFAGAMYCRFRVSHLFSIQPEVGWASKGDEGNLGITFVPTGGPSPSPVTFGTSFQRRIDYLEIPVLLRIGAPSGSFFEPYLLMGPGVAFRTGSNLDVSLSPGGAEPQYGRVRMARIFENVGTFGNPQYRDVDWSAIAGGGLAMGRAPFRIVLDTRYAMGLVGTFANADASIAHNGSWITTLGIELR